MHRSTSLPVKPLYTEPKQLQRSREKEVVYQDDGCADYSVYEQQRVYVHNSVDILSPEPPDDTDNDRRCEDAPSVTGMMCPFEWAGSTIDLNAGPPNSGRVIEKNGRENVVFRRIPEKSWRYLRDLVTTLIELDWRYMLSLFVGSYFLSWLFFAVLWYMVAYSHGDLFFDAVTGERLGEGKEPCIVGVYNFLSILIYSIETQTTIGFGEKYPSEECPESILLFIFQIIVSIALEGGMISIIYAKTARPLKQMNKFKFSDKAVICYRDGALSLVFRIFDPREQQTIHSKIRVYMIVDHSTYEGETIKTHAELRLEGNGNEVFMWPHLVCHVIDDESPLRVYTNARDLNAGHFELYVSIVGVSPTTAQFTEARTSYLPREILWGQRFVNIINYDPLTQRYIIDDNHFNTTMSVDMLSPDMMCTSTASKKR